MTPWPSRKPRNEGKPHVDRVRNKQDIVLDESPETADGDRDLVRGEGGTIELPTKPGDLPKDD
ncbi:hypothetical protein TSA1_26790 [Bradyrhizobium nitroreducens]|uniref:Uncharacterized protein n=1 Tax=Bradyrhizobium nitroreducens TaxID=709803 RepID=A0A2M6UH73_9BRAD|nr:hypothetical protein [Bradyrhizobium nitroreducens]PIT03976.1 hypothetical protein TSA1_26790 [Bradyrhizobium nitroreducens]